MRLWKDIFHDGNDFVHMFFDNFYEPDLSLCEFRGDNLVASMLTIPFDFAIKNSQSSIKGLYLCGLATDPKYRRQGIMTRLLEKAEDLARERGCAFTFLIPSNDQMRIYYADRGYVNSFWVIKENYTEVHDFKNELAAEDANAASEMSDVVISDFGSLDPELKSKFFEYVHKNELKNELVALQHNDSQIRAAVEEMRISDGVCLAARDENDEIKGVAFAEPGDDEKLNIKYLIADSKTFRFALLAALKNEYQKLGISLTYSAESTPLKATAIEEDYYIGSPSSNLHSLSSVEKGYVAAKNATPYGMIKIVNRDAVLNFLASNLLNKSEEEVKHSVKDIPTKELAELIFSKPGDEFLAEATGVCRMPMSMSLMFD